MGIDPMNNISIIIRILFAVTIFQQVTPWRNCLHSQQSSPGRLVVNVGWIAM
jgi:hypothetical protein